MFTLNIKADVQPIIRQLNAIADGLGDRAIVSALNKTTTQAKTQIARGIGAEYNLPASFIKERLSLQRARRAGFHFTAVLLGNPAGRAKRSMNVVHFLERSTLLAEARGRRKRGTIAELHFKIRRTGGKTTIDGAFLGNAGRTVFKRVGKARLPIEPVQTIGVPQMFMAKKIQLPVQAWISDNFPRIFAAELRYYLSTLR
jgi:hypothetical protein